MFGVQSITLEYMDVESEKVGELMMEVMVGVVSGYEGMLLVYIII